MIFIKMCTPQKSAVIFILLGMEALKEPLGCVPVFVHLQACTLLRCHDIMADERRE